MLTPEQVADLATAAASPGQPEALFSALKRLAFAIVGPGLFTVMCFDESRMEVERLYSSDPAAYLPGGRKRKRDTPWGRHLLEKKRVFVGVGAPAIQAAFDDHAIILGPGLRSVINVPLLFGGRCLGTLNVLMERKTVSASDVAMAQLLALIAVPGLLRAPEPASQA